MRIKHSVILLPLLPSLMAFATVQPDAYRIEKKLRSNLEVSLACGLDKQKGNCVIRIVDKKKTAQGEVDFSKVHLRPLLGEIHVFPLGDAYLVKTDVNCRDSEYKLLANVNDARCLVSIVIDTTSGAKLESIELFPMGKHVIAPIE